MKHLLTTLFLLCLCTLSAAGQTITRQKCATCGKLKVQCPYKGNHPVENKCASCGKVISKCPYKGNHPVEKKCPTCGKPLSKCPGHEKDVAKKKAEEAAAKKKAEQARKEREEQARQEQLRREQEEQARQEQLRREQEERERLEEEKRNALHWDESQKALCFDGKTYKMVYVSGGSFTSSVLVTTSGAAQCSVKNYYIGQTEVTQALWQVVMESNPSYWNGDDLPVEQVSWDDCQIFIEKLNTITGCTFRLPSTAEWEFAARGGNKSHGYMFSGSNTIGDVAWYEGNSDSQTHPVATKLANELGIFDMSGNVQEWCRERFDPTAAKMSRPVHPIKEGFYKRQKLDPELESRVHKMLIYSNSFGGSWLNDAEHCRVSSANIGNRSNNIGLRLVLQP